VSNAVIFCVVWTALSSFLLVLVADKNKTNFAGLVVVFFYFTAPAWVTAWLAGAI